MTSGVAYTLTVNTGSSSIKFALYECDEDTTPYLNGEISHIGFREGLMIVTETSGKELYRKKRAFEHHQQAFEILTQWLVKSCSEISIHTIGHRIVHGGEFYNKPVIIEPSVLDNLEKVAAYDPLHMESELLGIKLCQEIYPNAIHIACFDTAFHHTLPHIAHTLPLPHHIRQHGIRRYGFHGLSYEYIQQTIAKDISDSEAKGRLIIAHLGSGASITALNNGVSIDTSMAFTSNSGLVMSTRSGDLDPGLVMYLQEVHGYHTEQMQSLLNKDSGLKGLSGISGDMKELLEKEGDNTEAALAIDIFCYTVKKFIGSYAAALEGVDTLVFTGGIGERSAPIRRRICQGLKFLGIKLNDEANNANKLLISEPDGRVNVRVIPTNEELMIARHAHRLAQSMVSGR